MKDRRSLTSHLRIVPLLTEDSFYTDSYRSFILYNYSIPLSSMRRDVEDVVSTEEGISVFGLQWVSYDKLRLKRFNNTSN